MRWQTGAAEFIPAEAIRTVLATAAVFVALAGARATAADDASAAYQTETLRGRVVFLADALDEKYHITTVPEAKERTLALLADDGQLYPLVEVVRGRAFRADKRLRAMHVELLVRRYDKSPVVQVIRVFELADDGKYEIDYWCDICSIAMFELKACECCQGEIELRRQKVK
jgi:hypothetical protein